MTSKSGTIKEKNRQLFSLGTIVATQGILALQEETGFNILEFIDRHSKGDWGDLSDDDIKENEFSLRNGFRLLSAYKIPTGQRIWIITERDRSYTTVLLPDEY